MDIERVVEEKHKATMSVWMNGVFILFLTVLIVMAFFVLPIIIITSGLELFGRLFLTGVSVAGGVVLGSIWPLFAQEIADYYGIAKKNKFIIQEYQEDKAEEKRLAAEALIQSYHIRGN